MAKITPIGEKILVKPEEKDQQVTESGIIIAETSMSKPQIGIVEAVGEGRILENGTVMPLKVRVGDTVLFRKFAGTEIKIDKEDDTLLLMTERDVLGIIN